MRLTFVDPCRWDYDVDTPFERPLGGSQSALAYLTAALAGRGHDVVLHSRTSRPGVRRGVDCVGFDGVLVPRWTSASPPDAVIVLNAPADAGPTLRASLGPNVPLVLWTQHAYDQPAMAALGRADVRGAWSALVCVSEWHRTSIAEAYGLSYERVHVARNAIGPHFEGQFSDVTELAERKAGPPTLAYTSTPFRGLDVLLFSFEILRRRLPEAKLDVFSSMAVYQVAPDDDGYRGLYRDCRDAAGVEYKGSLSQPELARELRRTAFLGYPSTFPETSCIAVMEALASGLAVVTSDLGALAETTRGHATLVPAARPGSEGLVAFGETFADALERTLRSRLEDPEAFHRARMAQVADVNEHCTWARRAVEWEELISVRLT